MTPIVSVWPKKIQKCYAETDTWQNFGIPHIKYIKSIIVLYYPTYTQPWNNMCSMKMTGTNWTENSYKLYKYIEKLRQEAPSKGV